MPDKVTILTWGSATCPGGTYDSRVTFTMVKGSHTEHGANILDESYRVLVWSFKALAAGRYPVVDHAGQPFKPETWRAGMAGRPLGAGGLAGKLVEIRGDWKFLREAFHLRQHYGGKDRICHLCLASKRPGPNNFADFRRRAPHRALTTTAEWRAEQLEPPPAPPAPKAKARPKRRGRAKPKAKPAAARGATPLLGLPDFSIWDVKFDLMHCMDLGVLQVAVPSALAELTRPGGAFEGDTIEQRLQDATRRYRSWCSRTNCQARVKKITRAWVKLPHPQIGQVQAKAAALRAMLPWIRDVCADHKGSLQGKMRWAHFHFLASADRLMKRSPRHLPPKQQAALARRMEASLQCAAWLRRRAAATRVPLWKLLPKHHALTHIGYDAGGDNPRRQHCYEDEDRLGEA